MGWLVLRIREYLEGRGSKEEGGVMKDSQGTQTGVE